MTKCYSSGFKFSDSGYYENVTFEKISMNGCNLNETEFFECEFVSSDFMKSGLEGCRFEKCTFKNCDLSLAKMKGSLLLDTVFKDCKLIGIDWTLATDPVKADFYGCRLDNSVFYKTDMRRRYFRDCSLLSADFESANLSRCIFTGSDLSGCKFTGSDLTGADLRDAANYTINPLTSRIKGARFFLPEAVSLLDHLGIFID